MSPFFFFSRTVTGLSWYAMSLLTSGTAGRQPAGHLGHGANAPAWAPSAAGSSADTVPLAEVYGIVPATTPWDSTGWTGRVVVGEYLTGTFCGGCQVHERAFDAMLQRYPARSFIALAYHGANNFPIADPLDSLWERMDAWYGAVGGHPLGLFPRAPGWDNWIDGHPTSDGGVVITGESQLQQSTRYYQRMVARADSLLRTAPAAMLHVQAVPQGGTVATTVTVDSLAPGHADVYVRMFLVEDTVHLVTTARLNGKGPRVDHYMVVRLAARTAQYPLGLPLHGPGRVLYTFDVAKEQRRLLQYRTLGLSAIPGATEWQRDAQDEVKQILGWFSDERNWRMDPARLHVVALVQDAKTGDVLQAQMIPLPGAPRLELP